MTKRMLIDASHPEETRVVVVSDHQLEDFDLESSTKKQLKGNIYLAKVTRVEPSLQAAFVDYGGQRHGFLAFSEIHPDYYQIPQADRKLLEEEDHAAAEAAEAEAGAAEEPAGGDDGEGTTVTADPDEETAEVFDEQARRRSRLLRSYKIQEVIKRRQILLVQVVKEERGTKGAALTTYLSLPGRYSVLMPNTARGGGISRKIANPADRSRLKTIARDLKVPAGMGLIIRTAGQERNKAEIRRDYEYSLRLWNDIRERTLHSIAPCTIYEEGALVKRAIRDLYSRDIDEVWVEGEEGYREAKKIMGMLMPSRARRVKLYKEEIPLFQRHGVEDQLDAMHQHVVALRSGGSIVISATEALTAIDVNSGRSTRERNIEETALKTNLEAAEAISRHLRLRDIAGLVVIDFIDMAEGRNQRTVERKLREYLKSDRARVQLGRISTFGLLELSRQRLRPSFQELSTQPCPVCGGAGSVRSVESAALQALRAIETEGLKGGAAALTITLPLPVALYIVNQKRERLFDLERRYGATVEVRVDDELVSGSFELERTAAEAPPAEAERAAPVEAAAETEASADGRKRRPRRRRRRKSQREEAETEALAAAPAGETAADGGAEAEAPPPASGPPLAEEPLTEEQAGEEQVEPKKAARTEGKPRRRRRRPPPVAPAAEESAVPRAAAAQGNGADAALEPPDLAPPLVAEPVSPAWDEGVAAAGEPVPRHETATVVAGGPPDEEDASPRPQTELPPTAVVDREDDTAPPRRGWWSRFVRKDD